MLTTRRKKEEMDVYLITLMKSNNTNLFNSSTLNPLQEADQLNKKATLTFGEKELPDINKIIEVESLLSTGKTYSEDGSFTKLVKKYISQCNDEEKIEDAKEMLTLVKDLYGVGVFKKGVLGYLNRLIDESKNVSEYKRKVEAFQILLEELSKKSRKEIKKTLRSLDILDQNHEYKQHMENAKVQFINRYMEWFPEADKKLERDKLSRQFDVYIDYKLNKNNPKKFLEKLKKISSPKDAKIFIDKIYKKVEVLKTPRGNLPLSHGGNRSKHTRIMTLCHSKSAHVLPKNTEHKKHTRRFTIFNFFGKFQPSTHKVPTTYLLSDSSMLIEIYTRDYFQTGAVGKIHGPKSQIDRDSHIKKYDPDGEIYSMFDLKDKFFSDGIITDFIKHYVDALIHEKEINNEKDIVIDMIRNVTQYFVNYFNSNALEGQESLNSAKHKVIGHLSDYKKNDLHQMKEILADLINPAAGLEINHNPLKKKDELVSMRK